MERLDKVIASQEKYSRSEVKKMISQKRIKVNGEIVNKADIKVDVNTVNIEIDGNILNIKECLS